MKKLAGLPINPPQSSPKARLNPNTTQITLTTPMAMKLWRMVEMTFFFPTMPP